MPSLGSKFIEATIAQMCQNKLQNCQFTSKIFILPPLFKTLPIPDNFVKTVCSLQTTNQKIWKQLVMLKFVVRLNHTKLLEVWQLFRIICESGNNPTLVLLEVRSKNLSKS
jgi:hypothetical protein